MSKIIKSLFFLPFVFSASNSISQDNRASPFFLDAGNGGFNLNPRLSISETWIKNKSSGVNNRSGWTSDVNPGISVNKNSGSVRGSFDYSAHEIFQPGSSGASFQNSLNSSFLVEAVNNLVFVDLNGVISQQTISAFGEQTTSNLIPSSNRTEVSSFGISPYVRGHIINDMDYEVRYGLNSTRVKTLNSANSDQESASLKIGGAGFFNRLRWSTKISKQETDQNTGIKISVENFNFSSSYAIFNGLNLSATAGREIANYTSATKQSSGTYGGGVSWMPSNATTFSINSEKKLLGNMHSLSFEHRTPRTNWIASDVRSVSSSNDQASNSNTINTYNLYYSLYASIEPDPVKRSKLVLDTMQAQGLINSSSVLNGYLSNGTSVQRIQALSFAIFGIRDTITIAATKSSGRSLNNTLSNYSSIDQTGLSLGYSHKLTPDAMLSAQISGQKSFDDLTSMSSKINSVNISLSSKLSERTFATVSARHTVAKGGSSPYIETAVSGALTVKF
jgi:uncharacterized protein (PEP-CTERM system associated)